jgi:primosomal protein N' (replication factor Y)
MGIQKVEEELHAKFPEARVARADSDRLTRTAEYEAVIRDFEAGRVNVLLGTQMIAKGLDFPQVSFVGVVNADTSLAVPDFRAAERTFQLTTQVAGRAGRAQAGGHVVMQSLAGLTPALRFAAAHDFEGFVAQQLPVRRQIGFPPFSRLARVIVADRTESGARGQAAALAGAIREHIASLGLRADVLGPQTAPLARLRNRYRFDFLIRSPDASRLSETLERLRADGVLTPNTRHALVDVDPVSLL